MAQRKTSYTNADLKTGGPSTVYGEWRTTGKPQQTKLDQLLNEGRNIEDVLAEARGTIASTNQYAYNRDKPANDAKADTAIRNAERASSLSGQIAANPGRTIREGVMGAALPLSFASGPVGAAAAVPLSIEALSQFAQDPSLLGAGMAAATALPAMRMARGAKKAAAMADPFPRATAGAKWAQSREVPYRGGSGVSTPSMPQASAAPSRVPAPVEESGLRIVAKKQLEEAKRRRFDAIENRPPEPIRTGSMASLVDDAGEAADREFMAANPPKSKFAPPTTKVPMGVGGDEYASIRENGGAFNKELNTLTPEEAAAEDEFWVRIAQMFGR